MPTYIKYKGNTIHTGSDWIFIVLLSLLAFAISAWLRHIVWVIGTLASAGGATIGQCVLGALGLFIPPLGMIHGVMLFFGYGF